MRTPSTWAAELFIAICWGVWKNINDLRMGGKGKAGRSILRNALLLVEEYRAANEPKTEHLPEPPASVSWSPQVTGITKLILMGRFSQKGSKPERG